MKSTVNTKRKSVAKFPGLYTPVEECDGIAGLIVIMHEPRKGTVLHSGKSHFEIGKYFDCWVMISFEPYHGSVTIDSED